MGAFVAGLHGDAAIADHLRRAPRRERGPGGADGRRSTPPSRRPRPRGPYGRYPAGPLSREDTAGPSYRVGAATRRALGPRLAAAFEHVHMLVFHPRDAAPAALQALLDAGWSTTDIVTLSQIVAFLSFQIRVVTGLRTLAGRP